VLFPTIRFAIFLALVLPTSWLLMPKPVRWRVFMIAASFFFYSSWNSHYALLLAISIVGNQLIANVIHRAKDERGRRIGLVVAITGNLALLGWFKYAGFFADSTASGLGWVGIHWRPPIPNLLLPIGISFFTFQALSYVIDISRRVVRPARFLDFAVYLSFFPHLVAGPIVRASEFLPQLRKPRDPRHVDAGLAFWLIAAGLFKKVVVASYLATAANRVFDFPLQHGGLDALVGVYAYALQIYADFSGYTDMAIGLALLLGFRFPANFDAPYTATSLQDFWRRWHITLSRWLRDYVYIGLGGNRGGRRRTYRNIMITMLLGGLWHGAAWTFVCWGALLGGGLVFERWWRDRRTAPQPAGTAAVNAMIAASPAPPTVDGAPQFEIHGAAPARGGHIWLRRIVTFNFVCLGWIFFRAASVDEAFTVIGRILFHHGGAVDLRVVAVIALMLASQFVPTDVVSRLQSSFSRWSVAAQAAALTGTLIVVDALGPTGIAPFIYFRF
jgi:D-alanyl-lipoteichoic acid acyltransferase DltB (MBOAT superfamily)